MKEARDSVILHIADFGDIEELGDADAGKLLKALVSYVAYGELQELTGDARIMFRYIRRHIDADKEKYLEKCQKRAEAGKKGGRPKKEPDSEESNCFSEKAKKANGFSEKQKNPDIDIDIDNDIDIDIDIESDIDIDIEGKQIEKPEPPKPAQAPQPEPDGTWKGKRIAFLKNMLKMYDGKYFLLDDNYIRYKNELAELEGVP